MTDYHEQKISIDENTEVSELVEYTKKQAKKPITIQGVTVYNFSTHKVDKEALNNAIQGKLRNDLYQIPLQIQTGNMMLQSILPDKLHKAEVLLYNSEEKEYYAYKNFISDLPIETRHKIRQDIAETIQ